MEHEIDGVQDVRRVLWQWGRIDKRISELMEQMKIAVDRANSVYEISTGRAMDGQPHGSGTSDPVFRAVEKIAKMRELFAQEIEVCEAQIKEAQAFKVAVNEAMENLTPVQRDVIRLRYVDGHNWLYIGFKLAMDESNARRHERAACEKLANFIQTEKPSRFYPFS